MKRHYQNFFQLMKMKASRKFDLLNTLSIALNFCNKDKLVLGFQKIYNNYAASKTS